MRHTITHLTLALLALFLTLAAWATPAHADSFTGGYLTKINALRASKGLEALRLDQDVSSFAQAWTDHMANTGILSHNPDLGDAPGEWTKAGENVGVGADASSLFDAFVASAGHYHNLVDPRFTVIGIGVTVA